jgi:hypothetical protein
MIFSYYLALMVKAYSSSGIWILVFIMFSFSIIKGNAQVLNQDTLVSRYNNIGFENNTGVSFIFSEGKSALALHTVMGYRPNPNFFIGLGGGLEFYPETFLIPVYIDPRVNFNERKTSPFFYFDVGYAFGQSDSLDKFIQLGPRFNPGFGIKINTQSEIGMCISLGYIYQMAKFHKDFYLLDGTFTDRNINDYNLFVVRFELVF